MTRMNDRRVPIALGIILGVALLLRLGWVLVIVPNPTLAGGDALFYLEMARLWIADQKYPAHLMSAVGPTYVAILAVFYLVLPDAAVIQSVRIVQGILDTVTCLIAFDIGRRLFDWRVGLAAAAALALDLRFIVQAADLYTETLFILLLMSGIWAFVVLRDKQAATWRDYIVPAILFFLTALTRVIALPLPLMLFGSLILPKPTHTRLTVTAACVAIGSLLIAAYGANTYQQTGTFVVISDGLTSNFWMGSRGNGDWPGNQQFQADLNELMNRYDGRTPYLTDAFKIIAANPPAYLRLLADKLARSYLQPHGTVAFGGESLKDLLARVLAGQASIGDLAGGDAFFPKLYIYLFHFGGLIGGLAGMWLTRKQWLKVLPLTLPIVYFTVIYTFLTIIPRYLFPLMPLFTLLAAYAGVAIWDARKLPRAAAWSRT